MCVCERACAVCVCGVHICVVCVCVCQVKRDLLGLDFLNRRVLSNAASSPTCATLLSFLSPSNCHPSPHTLSPHMYPKGMGVARRKDKIDFVKRNVDIAHIRLDPCGIKAADKPCVDQKRWPPLWTSREDNYDVRKRRAREEEEKEKEQAQRGEGN